MEYVIILDYGTLNAHIYLDTRGFPEVFGTYSQAKAYAEKYELGRYQVVAVCSDSKNYLV